MTVGTTDTLSISSFGFKATASDSSITVQSFENGDVTLSASNKRTQKAAYLAGAESDITTWAKVVFSIPSDLAPGTYTLGVEQVTASDTQNVNPINGITSKQATLTVTGAPAAEGYTVAVSAVNAKINTGDTAMVKLAISNLNVAYYNAVDMKLTYDANVLNFDKTKSTGLPTDATVTDANGSLRIQFYGENRTDALQLAFTGIAAGESEVKVTEAKIDKSENALKNAPAATVTGSATITVGQTYTVNRDTNVVDGNPKAEAGKDYTFKLVNGLDGTYMDVKYKVGDGEFKDLMLVDGKYTIPAGEITGDITGDITITAVGKTYTVTKAGAGANDVTLNGNTATYGTNYTFTLNKTDNYAYTVTVTAGGKTVTSALDADGKTYTINGKDKLYGSAKKNYKDIAEQLNKLYEAQKAAIEACTKSADTDTELDRFSAGVVDLLITARVKTGVTMKQLSATLPEVTASYKELTAAQKEMLVNGKKLTDAQNLLATYERDLESLNQWVDSDKNKYSAVKTEIGKLAAETRTKLEGCTSAAGMTKVLNDYSAGVARLLLEKLNFTAGKTTLGELNKLSQVIEQASAAINGLTEEQKALLEKAQVANCTAAKELLAVYKAAAEHLEKWSSEDQSKYTDLNTALNSLAATARKELEASVDRDGAAKALNGYWCCMTHDADKNECALLPIPETQIQQAFLRLYYNLKHQGSHILPDLITNLQSIRERKFLWSVDVIELNKQIAELTSQNQLLATLRESGCVDPDIFISKSNKLTEQLRAAKQAKSRILNQDGDDTIPCTQELITILKRGPETLHDFDGELFGQLIDKVIIESNTSLRFRLKNGLELRESIERTVR